MRCVDIPRSSAVHPTPFPKRPHNASPEEIDVNSQYYQQNVFSSFLEIRHWSTAHIFRSSISAWSFQSLTSKVIHPHCYNTLWLDDMKKGVKILKTYLVPSVRDSRIRQNKASLRFKYQGYEWTCAMERLLKYLFNNFSPTSSNSQKVSNDSIARNDYK